MLGRTVPAIGFFLPCAAIRFAPSCFLCELKRVLSQAAVCCLCSTATAFYPTFKSLLPAFLLLPFGEVRGRGEGGGMPAFAVCSICLGGAWLRLVALFGGRGAGAGPRNAIGGLDAPTWGLSSGAQGSYSDGCTGGADELCPVIVCVRGAGDAL